MTTYVLCWHKQRRIEEVERGKIDPEWRNSIGHSDLDVLKISKNGRVYSLDSMGDWNRLEKAESVAAPE